VQQSSHTLGACTGHVDQWIFTLVQQILVRGGSPDVIIHDNCKTFKAAAVKRFMLLQGIKQDYTLPLSPWWGGFYEPLVRTVKTCLKKTSGKAFVTFEELQTVLCEIEMVINNHL
jgi:hypothetical protein